MKGRALIGIVAAVTAGLVAFVLVQMSTVTKKGVSVGIKKAQAACTDTGINCLPEVALAAIDGTIYTPAALADKVVMVNFWASWCGPCKREIPALANVYKRYADKGFVILGIMTDDIDDRALDQFSTTYGLDYPVVRVDEDIFQAFGWPDALPTTYVYDRSGHLAFQRRGEVSEAELERVVDKLLAEAAPAAATAAP